MNKRVLILAVVLVAMIAMWMRPQKRNASNANARGFIMEAQAQTTVVGAGAAYSQITSVDANTASFSNSTNAQTVNIYGSVDNVLAPVNYERLRIFVDSGAQHRPTFTAEKGGTGVNNGMDFGVVAGGNFRFNSGGSIGLSFGSTGISTYGGVATAGQGVAPIRGTQSLTAQNAAISATSVYASAPAGLYRLCFNAATTTSGTGTTATVSVTWTDAGGAKTFTSATWALNAVDVTGQVNGCQIVRSAASQPIQVSTAGTFGTSVYRLDATVETLQ